MQSQIKYIALSIFLASTLFMPIFASNWNNPGISSDYINQDTTKKQNLIQELSSDTIKPIQDSTKNHTIDSLKLDIQNTLKLDTLDSNQQDTIIPPTKNTKKEKPVKGGHETIQVLDSSAIINDSSLVQYFTANIDSFALGKIHTIDTALYGMQNFDPSFGVGRYYASLGNIGLPAKNLHFKPQISEGFNYVNSPLELYTYKNEDVKYYRLFRPFTDILYAMGPKKENTLRVIHTQNISRGLNIGLNFKFINAPGSYQQQYSDNKNLYVTTRYSTRNGRYGFIANYIHDKLIVEENGGNKSDSAFKYSLEVNRALIDINLTDATNTLKKGGFFINQYFNIGKAPYMITDSLGQKKIHHGLPLGRLTHTLAVERRQYFYEGIAEDDDFYSGFDEILNTTNTFDSTSITKIENEFKWTNLGYDIQIEDKPIYMYFGVKQQYIEVADTLTKQVFNHIIPKAGLSTFLFKSFRLKVDGFYVIGDHNDGDYSLNARLNQVLGSEKKNFGVINLRAEMAKQSPSWFYNLYHGNHLRWEEDFKAENYLTFEAKYSFKGITAGVNYQKIDNYIFMNKKAHPDQTDLTQSVFTATLDYTKKIKDFTIDAHLIYQKPKSDSLLRVPEFIGHLSINYTKPLFENATTIQPGIEVFYNTSYFADAYMPATRSFYLQSQNKIGNAIYADLYLNFTIKNTIFFFKYQHFNAALTGFNYYLVPHYPMHDYAIKFGLIWRFID